jgi:hypothetical protein
MLSHNKIRLSLLSLICTFFLATAAETHESRIVLEHWKQNDSWVVLETPYGRFPIKKPVLIDLLKSEPLQRLKGIHQYGPGHYVKKNLLYKGKIQQDYTRWEHSICIFTLARRMQLPLEMQIAALLHDLSHTAFSHVGDFVFGKNEHTKDAYQDDILPLFLEEHGTADILRTHHINIQQVLQKPSFLDKLDYTLVGGLLAGELNVHDLNTVIDNLRFYSKCEADQYLKKTDGWFFDNKESAFILGRLSLKMDSLNSGAPWNTYVYKYMAKALARAFELNLFTREDFAYQLLDEDLWGVLQNSDDEILQHYLYKVTNHELILESMPPSDLTAAIDSDRCSAEPEDRNKLNKRLSGILPLTTKIVPKFRGLDPNVNYYSPWSRSYVIAPLTLIDDTYSDEYYDAEAKIKKGWRISTAMPYQKGIVPITPRAPSRQDVWCGK